VVHIALDWPKTCPDFTDHGRLEFDIIANGTPGNKSNGSSTGLSLYECFKLFHEPETLEETESWYCSKCKDHVCARKTLQIYSLPPIVVLHLKRFSYSEYNRDKLEDLVDYPVDGLDLTDYCLGGTVDGTKVPLIYDLVGVSEHHGGLGGGHYTAVCRSTVDGKWYNFDDNHVSEARQSGPVSASGYVLFYLRHDLLEHYTNTDWCAAAAAAAAGNGLDSVDMGNGGAVVDNTQMDVDDYQAVEDATLAPSQHDIHVPFYEDDASFMGL